MGGSVSRTSRATSRVRGLAREGGAPDLAAALMSRVLRRARAGVALDTPSPRRHQPVRSFFGRPDHDPEEEDFPDVLPSESVQQELVFPLVVALSGSPVTWDVHCTDHLRHSLGPARPSP